ncbi:cupin domain-containing protein [Conexibacter sp. JD483]|uniref:cupin domain-containing protein n=1 Tax=unclassified Conexibacter TaxID=2627773 RepID=UPI002716D953|nr:MULTISPECIES: cupin domain-containing protein [unclassified Conexibacter]MDO8187651.1 cupin domain-containing protein [Conexibacter sp. CPCC 205706]MDO8199836.1 cupin domain-containing protein [Conexibacter sp. CPCC 205762]MDR9370213.1 cupin domain-containing protein [Conexibacter sp. JD483]
MPTIVDHPVQLLPEQVAALEWEQLNPGVRARVLAASSESGARTRMLALGIGARLDPIDARLWQELYVLDGELSIGGRAHRAGSYLCWRPGDAVTIEAGPEGANVLQLEDAGTRMRKPFVALTAEQVEAMAWRPMEGRSAGFYEKVLVEGPCGSKTHLVKIEPLGDGAPNQRHAELHDHGEEMLALDGCYFSGEGRERHAAGTYTNNPPGTHHGPFEFSEPYLCLEVKNFA